MAQPVGMDSRLRGNDANGDFAQASLRGNDGDGSLATVSEGVWKDGGQWRA